MFKREAGLVQQMQATEERRRVRIDRISAATHPLTAGNRAMVFFGGRRAVMARSASRECTSGECLESLVSRSSPRHTECPGAGRASAAVGLSPGALRAPRPPRTEQQQQHQHLQSSHLRGYPDAAYHACGFLSEVNPTRCHLRPGPSRPSPRCFILPHACDGHFEVPRLTPVPISSISPVLYSSLEDAEQSEGQEDVYIASLSMETLFPLKSLSLGQDFAFSASSVPSHGDSVI